MVKGNSTVEGDSVTKGNTTFEKDVTVGGNSTSMAIVW
ncbi:hypothetical protein AC062_1763 [Pasteurellaceae bacterium NI1060]|nr:hypothetical protein AC062_1763 [Pasteurellaceae bacterium NI1060]